MTEEEWTYCNECKEPFDDAFDFVDHFLKEDEDFDPYLILPNGYRLMVGSLLRYMYENADQPENIKHFTQSIYVTLFGADSGLDVFEEAREDLIVETEMNNFDSSLKSLLEKEDDGEGGE